MRYFTAGFGRDRRRGFRAPRSLAGAEIETRRRMSLEQQLSASHMGGGEIRDMNVVANRGPVRSVVIVTEHRKIGT